MTAPVARKGLDSLNGLTAPPAPRPVDEAARLDNLHKYHILDTAPEQSFDDLARLAALICGTPVAEIAFVDAERQWSKAVVGTDRREVPRDVAFCSHTILSPGLTVVPDMRQDARFADNPLVTGGTGVRFYRNDARELLGLPQQMNRVSPFRGR